MRCGYRTGKYVDEKEGFRMVQRTEEAIRKVANIILEEFDIQIPIKDIGVVVTTLNGKIEEIDSNSVVGKIQRREEDNGFIIKVSKYQPVDSRNLAIAQELGYLFLHMGYMSDWELWESFNPEEKQTQYTKKEFQAHEFAANLLMPKQQYFDFVYKHQKEGKINPQLIADYFGVPKEEAVNRGKWLGVLTWR